MKLSNTLLGLGVGLFAGSVSALSLGEAHGQVVLGRPMDLVFDIYTDPGMELDIACISASAVAGETRIDSSRLRIAALPVVAGRPPSVRIRSSMVIVEPILTVRLVMGCSGVVERSYDFFANPPTEATSGALPVVIAPLDAAKDVAVRKAVRTPVAVPAPAIPRPPASLDAAPPDAQPNPPKPPKVPKPAKERVPRKTVAVVAPVAAAAATAQPHSQLMVEPLGDWLAGSGPVPLRLSPGLQETPAEAPTAQRAQVAALRKTLNTAAEDMLQTQVRLQQQQAEIDAGRASREKMQGVVTDLRERMERLDNERFSATLVYGLLGLLVLAFVLLGWLWQRLRGQTTVQRTEPDWNGPAALSAKDVAAVPAESTESAGTPPVPEFSLVAVQTDVLPPAATPVAAAASQTVLLELEPATAPTPAVRVLHSEELFDLQQQAEFFMSVGEHDQAIEVMQKHIAENEKASPLMYLELLRLYCSLSRIDDFKQLRAQFQQHFNALVPEFSAFQEGGRTLLDYPETVASIEAIWSDAAVLPLLENCIFRRSDSHSGAVKPFELTAYDDLLLLYAIASTTSARARGAPPPRQRTTPYADAVPSQPLEPLEPLPSLEQEFLTSELLSPKPLSMVGDESELDFDLGPFLDVDMPIGAELEAAQQAPASSNLIEYDAFLLSDKTALSAMIAPPPNAVVPGEALDLDLSEPGFFDTTDLPPLTRDDLPAIAHTPAPAAHQPIGFGAISDRFEARFDLDEDEAKPLKL